MKQQVTWNNIGNYAGNWDPNYTVQRSFDNEYHFVYPFKSIREELEVFPELREIARQKLINLGAEMSAIISEIAKMKKLIDQVQDPEFRKFALAWITIWHGSRLERLQKEYSKFEFIGNVIMRNGNAANFDELMETARNINVIDTAERFGKVRKSGSRYVMNCLFHQEDTPSMVLYPDGQSFHCFGCGKSGDSIDIIMHRMGVSLQDAIKILI